MGQALVIYSKVKLLLLVFFFISHQIPFVSCSNISHFRTRNDQYWGREKMIMKYSETQNPELAVNILRRLAESVLPPFCV